jgi:predicted CDP-diglyceride synthetase/phosphatidate cytidylyltransferase
MKSFITAIVLLVLNFNVYAENYVLVENKYAIPVSKISEYETKYREIKPVTSPNKEIVFSKGELSIVGGVIVATAVAAIATTASFMGVAAASVTAGAIAAVGFYTGNADKNSKAPVEERKLNVKK